MVYSTEEERREAELAAKREEHAKERIVASTAAKLVKKADVEARVAAEAGATETEDGEAVAADFDGGCAVGDDGTVIAAMGSPRASRCAISTTARSALP